MRIRVSIVPAAVLSLVPALMLGGLPAGGWPGEPQAPPWTDTGHVTIEGHATPYLIRHLPVSSFPQLPGAVGNLLKERGCLIPQTYEAHQPENVVEASLERAGSKDWAVLCSEKGTVSLLVFFGDSATASLSNPRVLATAPEMTRLQAHGADGVLGFDWGIDSASPEQVHEAQMGMRYPPRRLDHDALADSVIDGATVYHFYTGNAWAVVETGE
ncbi:MAG TPA: hypothetical protein VGG26_10685 [Terracidiphilus sp.]|jgi:hypothetical protein